MRNEPLPARIVGLLLSGFAVKIMVAVAAIYLGLEVWDFVSSAFAPVNSALAPLGQVR